MSGPRERLYERLLGDEGALACDCTSMATREDVEAMLDEIPVEGAAAPPEQTIRCRCGRPSTWTDGCCIKQHSEAAQGAAALDGPEFGRTLGEVMKAHPTADARLVNDILKIVSARLAEAAQGAAAPPYTGNNSGTAKSDEFPYRAASTAEEGRRALTDALRAAQGAAALDVGALCAALEAVIDPEALGVSDMSLVAEHIDLEYNRAAQGAAAAPEPDEHRHLFVTTPLEARQQRLPIGRCAYPGCTTALAAQGAAAPPELVSRSEYQRIRHAVGEVLRALSTCPYCRYEEGHHDPNCVLSSLVNAVEEPHLDRLNSLGRWRKGK